MSRRFELMKPSDIEAWTLEVCDRVKRGQRIEDMRVEAKSAWIEAAKAARRLAGHANAAGGEPILWVIGLDENRGVVTLDCTDLASWWEGVRSQFCDMSPALKDVIVPVHEQVVVALLFDTDRAPFVTKNPSIGKPNGGPVETEVPWREGTQVRSARREDLLRILLPQRLAPLCEPRVCEVRGHFDSWVGCPVFRYTIHAELYLVPRGTPDPPLVLPNHKASLTLLSSSREQAVVVVSPTLSAKGRLKGGFRGPGVVEVIESATVAVGPTEVVAAGPGMIVVDGNAFERATENYVPPEPLTLSITLEAAEGGRPLNLHVDLPTGKKSEDTTQPNAKSKPSWYWRWEAGPMA